MKNILFATSFILLLTACNTTSVKSTEKPVVSSEIIKNTPTIPAKSPAKITPPPTPKKVTASTPKPEATADDLTKELDSLIDTIVSSK